MNQAVYCRFCGKEIIAKKSTNMTNIMTTHVVVKCKVATYADKVKWRMAKD